MDILTQWIIPFMTVAISIWFASSAKKDAEKAQQTLTNVEESIQGWMKQLINSTNDIIQANPTIVDRKMKLAKIESLKGIIASIQVSVEASMKSPAGGASGHTQQQLLTELMKSLDKLVDKME